MLSRCRWRMEPWSENVTEGGKEEESDLFLGMGVYTSCAHRKKKACIRQAFRFRKNYRIIWWLLPELQLRQPSWPCGPSSSVPSWRLLQGPKLLRWLQERTQQERQSGQMHLLQTNQQPTERESCSYKNNLSKRGINPEPSRAGTSTQKNWFRLTDTWRIITGTTGTSCLFFPWYRPFPSPAERH